MTKAQSQLNIAKKQVEDDSSNVISKALVKRIESFLPTFEKKMEAINSDLKKVDDSIMKIIKMFGENCKAADFGEEDGELTKTFFSLVTTFARSFQAAVIDNTFRRTADAQKSENNHSKNSEASVKTSEKNDKEGDSKGDKDNAPQRRDNIFGSFQKSQGAGVSADQLISDFKSKLMSKFQNVDDDSDEDDDDGWGA